MSDLFESLFSNYFDRAKEKFEGTVVAQYDSEFSVPLMDASFEFSTTAVHEIKSYAENIGISIKNVFVFAAFDSNLKRTNHSQKSETKLCIVKDAIGDHHALLFSGCTIGNIK